MGSFCPFWALQNYFEGWGQIQQSYWDQSPMFFFIQPHMGPFLPFLDPLGLFWDWGLVQKMFGTY